MQADADFINLVQAGQLAGRLLTQAWLGCPYRRPSEWRPGQAGPAGR